MMTNATPKQVVMVASMQPKGNSKMSVNTGTSSSQKGGSQGGGSKNQS